MNRVQQHIENIGNLVKQTLQLEESYREKRRGDIYHNTRLALRSKKIRYEKEFDDVFTLAKNGIKTWEVMVRLDPLKPKPKTLKLYFPVDVTSGEICDWYQYKYSAEVLYIKESPDIKIIGFPRNEETGK